MTLTARRILLGEISSAHGIRGEVLVRSFAAEPEDIAAYGPLEDESGKRTYDLDVVRVTPKGVIARVAGVADRTEAETLKGVKLYVERTKLPETGEEEFYHADLIGLQINAHDGCPKGEIVAVVNFGAGDLLEIRYEAQQQTVLVPLTKACVPVIDLQHRLVTVVLPEMIEAEVGESQTIEDGGDTGREPGAG